MDNLLQPNPEYERRLRALAQELAAGIQEPPDILKQLGFENAEYQKLAGERVFRELLASAIAEWNAAGSTQKRAKLKAAVAVENTIHHLAAAVSDTSEPLSSRTGAYLALLKTGGMGNAEAAVGQVGAVFKLEIHMASGRKEVIGALEAATLESEAIEAGRTQSRLLDGRDWEDMGELGE